MRPPHAWTTDNKGLGDKLLCILVTEALLLHDKRVDIAQEVPKYVTNQVLASYCCNEVDMPSDMIGTLNIHSIGDRYESELGHMYKASGRSLTGVRAEVGRLMAFYQTIDPSPPRKTCKGSNFDVGIRLLEFLVADALDQRPTSKDSRGNDTVGHDVQFYINKERCLVPYSRSLITSNYYDDRGMSNSLSMIMMMHTSIDIHLKLARGWTPGSNTFGQLVPFVEDLMKWVDDNNVNDKAVRQAALDASSRQSSLYNDRGESFYVVTPDLVVETAAPATAGRGPLRSHTCSPHTIKWFSKNNSNQYSLDMFPCCGQVVRTDASTGQKYSRYECTRECDSMASLTENRSTKTSAKKTNNPIATWGCFILDVVIPNLDNRTKSDAKANNQLCTIRRDNMAEFGMSRLGAKRPRSDEEELTSFSTPSTTNISVL